MWYKKDKVNRFNDGATSIGAGQYSRLPMQVFQSIRQLGVKLGYYSQFNRMKVYCTGTVYSFNILNMTRKVIIYIILKGF